MVDEATMRIPRHPRMTSALYICDVFFFRIKPIHLATWDCWVLWCRSKGHEVRVFKFPPTRVFWNDPFLGVKNVSFFKHTSKQKKGPQLAVFEKKSRVPVDFSPPWPNFIPETLVSWSPTTIPKKVTKNPPDRGICFFLFFFQKTCCFFCVWGLITVMTPDRLGSRVRVFLGSQAWQLQNGRSWRVTWPENSGSCLKWPEWDAKTSEKFPPFKRTNGTQEVGRFFFGCRFFFWISRRWYFRCKMFVFGSVLFRAYPPVN